MYSDKQQKKTAMTAGLIGALIGGVIVAAVLLAALYLTGNLPSRKSDTAVLNNGTTIDFNGVEPETAVEAVAQIVPNSVVGVYVTGTNTADSIFGPQSQQFASTGSGFFVTEDGYIVTNQHVVNGGQQIKISTADGGEYDGTLVWSDESLDLAVIKVDIKGAAPLSLGDSDNLRVGQRVIAVGNPLGLAYSRTVTAGIISAIDRTLVADNTLIAEGLIQTDAAINSGNSGGPLVNMNGEVIGVNTYKQQQGEGLGFAIPINLFKPIIESVVKTGTFEAPLIGITGYDPEQAKYLGADIDLESGIYVADIQAGSPAQKAGLQNGDVIKKVDGKDVNTMVQLRTILYNHKKGDKIQIVYTRGNQEKTAELTL